MESRWGRELREIFEDLQGDIDVFRKDTETRQKCTKLTDEIFHLEFTLPHKLGLPNDELKGIQKRIRQLPKNLLAARVMSF